MSLIQVQGAGVCDSACYRLSAPSTPPSFMSIAVSSALLRQLSRPLHAIFLSFAPLLTSIVLQKDTRLPYLRLASLTWPRTTHFAIELHLPHCLHLRVLISTSTCRVQPLTGQGRATRSSTRRRAPRSTASSKGQHRLIRGRPLWPNQSQRCMGTLQFSLYVSLNSLTGFITPQGFQATQVC